MKNILSFFYALNAMNHMIQDPFAVDLTLNAVGFNPAGKAVLFVRGQKNSVFLCGKKKSISGL